MKILNKIITIGTFILLPYTNAFADFGYHRHNDNCSSPRYGNNYSHQNSFYPQRRPSYNYQRPSYNSYRNNNPYKQISYGYRNGQLSYDEVRELNRDLSEIKEKERRYYSDGYLDNREKNKLHDKYKDFRHDLKHELYDGERRW
ncbi:MAG: hypothetical protein KBC84_03085 [Proteobacteria bacterium]|nr:hypothetical protein [Pseudomonadota bacterium]